MRVFTVGPRVRPIYARACEEACGAPSAKRTIGDCPWLKSEPRWDGGNSLPGADLERQGGRLLSRTTATLGTMNRVSGGAFVNHGERANHRMPIGREDTVESSVVTKAGRLP